MHEIGRRHRREGEFPLRRRSRYGRAHERAARHLRSAERPRRRRIGERGSGRLRRRASDDRLRQRSGDFSMSPGRGRGSGSGRHDFVSGAGTPAGPVCQVNCGVCWLRGQGRRQHGACSRARQAGDRRRRVPGGGGPAVSEAMAGRRRRGVCGRLFLFLVGLAEQRGDESLRAPGYARPFRIFGLDRVGSGRAARRERDLAGAGAALLSAASAIS